MTDDVDKMFDQMRVRSEYGIEGARQKMRESQLLRESQLQFTRYQRNSALTLPDSSRRQDLLDLVRNIEPDETKLLKLFGGTPLYDMSPRDTSPKKRKTKKIDNGSPRTFTLKENNA